MVGPIKHHPHPPAPLCLGSLACAGRRLYPITRLMATGNCLLGSHLATISLKYFCYPVFYKMICPLDRIFFEDPLYQWKGVGDK